MSDDRFTRSGVVVPDCQSLKYVYNLVSALLSVIYPPLSRADRPLAAAQEVSAALPDVVAFKIMIGFWGILFGNQYTNYKGIPQRMPN